MTDTKALRRAIEARGLTVSSLARVIGMKKQTLYNRMNDPDFRASEIEAIAKALDFSLEERDEIFFTKKGD